jgi:hypothetical protein
MRIILISANGHGAGKTYLAELIGGVRTGLAYGVRRELAGIYPEFQDLIFSTKAKDKAFKLPSGKTVRQELVELGQEKCKENPTYWCEKWKERAPADGHGLQIKLVVDDLRKEVELAWFRDNFQDVTHFHLKYSGASAEKEFDDLEVYADYVIYRQS